MSLALWRAHVERALRAVRTLKAGLPQPGLAARDPMALRALVLILVVASFVGAGGERLRRISAAFDWAGVVAGADEVGGRYCENCHVGVIVPDAREISAISEGVRGYALDPERAKALWAKSEEWVGERF